MGAKALVIFYKDNRTEYQARAGYDTFSVSISEGVKVRISLVTAVNNKRYRRIIVYCHLPEYLFHNRSKQVAEQYDAAIAGITGTKSTYFAQRARGIKPMEVGKFGFQQPALRDAIRTAAKERTQGVLTYDQVPISLIKWLEGSTGVTGKDDIERSVPRNTTLVTYIQRLMAEWDGKVIYLGRMESLGWPNLQKAWKRCVDLEQPGPQASLQKAQAIQRTSESKVKRQQTSRGRLQIVRIHCKICKSPESAVDDTKPPGRKGLGSMLPERELLPPSAVYHISPRTRSVGSGRKRLHLY